MSINFDSTAMPSTTLVVLLIGEVASLLPTAKKFLHELRYFAERDVGHMGGHSSGHSSGQTSSGLQIVVAIDGPAWRAALSAEDLAIGRARVEVLAEQSHLPAKLVNAALGNITTDYVALLAVGSEVSTWYSNLAAWAARLSVGKVNMIAGYRSQADGRDLPSESHLVHQHDQFSSDYPHAWLQMLDLVPMSNTIVATAFIRQLGGFTEVVHLQRVWWWDFCLRASKQQPISTIALQPVPGVNWHRFQFGQSMAATTEAALRELTLFDAQAARVTPMREDEVSASLPLTPLTQQQIAADSPTWRALPNDLQRSFYSLVIRRGRALRIAVVGGVNEPAHNQLCFFNYFALMRRWGMVSWRSVLDERVTTDDVADCDLVIFSRVRNDNGVMLMQSCKDRGIRTLYMLDDNWFWLGREWDEYSTLFTPGAKPYENFLSCVRTADTTLTYRAPLAADLAAYANRVVTLPTNVDLRAFAATGAAPNKRIVIGYVGSLRKNMVAFEALLSLAQQRAEVDILVMSNALPEELGALPAERVRFEPYQFNYAGYAATVTAARPDVLVAPVGHTRFEASKCPNKYLEISACGAAGVYSRAEPYLSYVEDGVTGLFADDTVESWRNAISRLLDDAALRRAIANQAYADVAATFDTRAVLPQFVQMLVNAIEPT